MKGVLFTSIALWTLFIGRTVAQVRQLDYFLNQGLKNSPLLRDFSNQLISNGIDSALVRANYKPQVSFTSNNFYAPVINGFGYDPTVTNGGGYSAMLNVNQNLASKKYLQTQFYGIRLTKDSLSNEKKISEGDLKRTITSQYIVTYGDEQNLLFYNQVHELLTSEDSVLRKLTQSNVYRQADYLTFLVTLQQQELQIKQLQIQYRTDLSTLNYLCGIFDTTVSALEYPAIQLAVNGDAINSIFYRKYILDSLSLVNNLSLLKYNYRPRVTIYANGGYNSSLMYQAEKNIGAGVGLNLNLPIYDGNQRKLQIRKITLKKESVINYRDFFNAQYNQQITMLRQQLVSTEALIKDIDAQIKYAETLIQVNRRFMTTGDAKISDVVIAINNYLTAKNLLTQNNINRLQIINQINYWNR
ncbi:MAG: TolC family protein [Bacteroidetes bacterium]|nr:TolC family protein [Bacteroidota bacterium]